jgi:hypothetical protein
MKNFRPSLLAFAFLSFGCANVFSQTTPKGESSAPADILALPAQEIEAFDALDLGEGQLALRFPYASAAPLNAADYEAIRSLGKISVEYIYSQYTQSLPNQARLNRARFATLQRIAPDLFHNPNVSWDVFVQTGAKDADSARKLFHGFVITYKPSVTVSDKEAVKSRLDLLMGCLKKLPPTDAPTFSGGEAALREWLEKNVKFPKEELTAKGARKAALIEFRIDPTTHKPRDVRVTQGVSERHNTHIKAAVGKMPAWSEGNTRVEFAIVLQFGLDGEGQPSLTCDPLHGYDPVACGGSKPDSLINKVMARNKNWKKLLIVEDVTASMMPYMADLLLWNSLKSNLENSEHFVFFNDGDTKDDFEKAIGSAGGLYHIKSDDVQQLEETMVTAMASGDGGDTPENDIEAVLAGIEKCPECAEVVLIADNNATPRDLELLPKVTKPVHVVLCGARLAPNPAHLLIAWKTKGSLHTIHEDITTLAEMQEGQSITVMGRSFRIINGKFVPTNKF